MSRSVARGKASLRRLCLATTIILLHVVALQALFTHRQALHLSPDARSLTWLTLPPLESVQPEPIPHRPGPAVNFIAPAPIEQAPQLKTPSPAAPIARQDPALTALKDFLACGLPGENRYGLEERQRCDKMRRVLSTGPMPAHIPIDSERKLAQRFARDKVVEDSPLLAQCFSPVGMGFSTRNCDGGGQLNLEALNRMEDGDLHLTPRQLRAVGSAP